MTTDDGPLVYYKLTLWAFGSGELKMQKVLHYGNFCELGNLSKDILYDCFKNLFLLLKK